LGDLNRIFPNDLTDLSGIIRYVSTHLAYYRKASQKSPAPSAAGSIATKLYTQDEVNRLCKDYATKLYTQDEVDRLCKESRQIGMIS
jgi:uncharacterized protein Smg (DUF494 family)